MRDMSEAMMRGMRRVVPEPVPVRGDSYRAVGGQRAVFWLLAVMAVGMATLALWVASGALW